MAKDYIEKRDDGFWIKGKRVALDSIVYAYLAGYSPEAIRGAFPLVSLEEVHGAIAFYLANASEVESSLIERDEDLDAFIAASRDKNPNLFRALEEARRNLVLQKQR